MNGCFQANILAVKASWTSFVQLSIDLGTLADGLGSFPLGRDLSTPRLTAVYI